MLTEVLQWLGASDEAIVKMGPSIAIVLALLGGYGITQLLKFPLAEFVIDRWRDWTIRAVAVPATWLCAHYIGGLPPVVQIVVAVSQPLAYTLVIGIVRHYWPWLEAGKVAGSVAPSDQAIIAMRDRKG